MTEEIGWKVVGKLQYDSPKYFRKGSFGFSFLPVSTELIKWQESFLFKFYLASVMIRSLFL